MTSRVEPPEIAREAMQRHDWEDAYRELSEADERGLLDAAGLRALAETAWWTGRPETVLEAAERAYGAYLAEKDPGGAALAAYELALQHAIRLTGPMAMAWIARADQHAAEAPDSAAAGYVKMLHGMMALEGGASFESAIENFDAALEVAGRTGDDNLRALASHQKGRALCGGGDQTGGMALMDEAMVSVVGGQLTPFASGVIYCSMISACADIGDIRRAAEWTEATTRWCERFSINGFPGVCRVHRAGVLRLRGDLPSAESEARRAAEELPKFNFLNGVGEAFYEIGEIRRRIGDFAGADDAYATAHEHGKAPQPGLARLRLAQGNLDSARSGVSRVLADTKDRPRRVELLSTLASIALAAGDPDSAMAAADEIDELVSVIPGTTLESVAASTRGAVLLGSGDAEGALPHLGHALRGWQDVDAPYEAAEVRLLLGNAYLAAGDDETAAMELRTARSTFQRLGAAWMAERAGELLGGIKVASGDRVHRALMFTDIVKSTDLVGAIGDEAWETLLAWHDQTLQSLFASHGGEVAHHTGDGFFVAFEDAAAAVQSAIAVQRALAEHRRTSGFAPTVRIGIHSADATQRGRDYSGGEVHVAARVADKAEGGEIVVTDAVLAEAGTSVQASNHRDVELKGVTGPVAVASVDWH
ncbi:MAG TPA: adenylate/guanylate cyclase domain-containing protein [Acidimicrobiia bacterium]